MKLLNPYKIYEGTDRHGFPVRVLAESIKHAENIVGTPCKLKMIKDLPDMELTNET